MNLYFLVVFGIYFVLMLGLLIGWQESFIRRPSEVAAKHFSKKISIIVPFRNEAAGIAWLLKDIIAQRYLSEQMEVILVDDHSTDSSCDVVRNAIRSRNHYHLLSLPADRFGKKQAITAGIQFATGEIIITTDADCRVGQDWVMAMDSQFDDSKITMVLGGVRIAPNGSFFSGMQALEFCSLIGTAAATASLGFPTMCNGANLAFRKSAFTDVHGYDGNTGIASGDDEFLMRKIDKAFPGSIAFLARKEAVVTTGPASSRREFIDQRIRWAGKWKHNTSWISRSLAVYVLLFQASFVGLWLAPWVGWIEWHFAVFFVTGKIVLEGIFLYVVGSFLDTTWKTTHFLALQFIYPVYVVYIGVSSLFRTSRWKGRVG